MKKIFTLSIALFFSYQAYSQIKGGDTTELLRDLEAKTTKAKAKFTKNNPTPYGNSSFSNVISNFSLSSLLNNGENAKIEIKFKGKDKNGVDNFWSGGFAVDQKLGKQDKKATLYDFNKGVSPGTTVSINVQKILGGKFSGRFTKKRAGFFEKLRHELYQKEPERFKGMDERDISVGDLQKMVTDLGNKKQLQNMLLKKQLFFNLKIAYTKSNFSFATDSISLKKMEENYFTPEITFSLGTPLTVNSYFALNYSYSESYTGADEIDFIRPFGTTPNLYSETLAFGKPKFKKDHKIISEYRRTFFNDSFAISPSIAYGFASKKIGFSLPLYFIQGLTKEDKPNGLQGGLSFSYITNTANKWSAFKDGFGAQLIITAPFTLFGN